MVCDRLDEYAEFVEYRRQAEGRNNRHTAFAGNHSIFDKSDCAYIFRETKVDGANMYEQRSRRVMLKYKIDKLVIESQIKKIDCLL